MKKVDYLEIKIATTRTAFFNNLKDVIEEINIHDVLKLSSGENLPTHKMIDGKYPVFGGGGSTSLTHNVFNVDFETLAIGRVGARCGCVFKVPKQSWVTDNALYALTFDKRFKLEFLIHYLSYVDLNQYANRAAQPVISLKRISSINFPLIDIERQKDFIKIIEQAENGKTYFGEEYSELNIALKSVDSINQLQAELSSQLTKLANLNQAILQEAVQGKLVHQNPTDEPASELLKRIKSDKLKSGKKEKPLPPIKPEEIPFEIPESWVWCRLGEIAISISTGPFGTMLHQSDYVENGIPLVNPINIVNEKIVASNKMMISPSTLNRLKNYALKIGDIVIARRGEMGRCAVVTEIEDGWLCGTGSFFLRLHNDIYRPYFIKVLGSETAKSFLLAGSVGATVNNLNHRILNNLPIPLPPLSEQIRIVAEIEKQLAKTKQIKEHVIANQHATEQLLKALLHGAFEVKEMEEV